MSDSTIQHRLSGNFWGGGVITDGTIVIQNNQPKLWPASAGRHHVIE